MIKRHRFIKQKTYIPFFFLFFFWKSTCLLSIFKRIPNAKSVVITIRILKYKRGIEYKSLNYQSMKYTLKFTTWWAANNLLFKWLTTKVQNQITPQTDSDQLHAKIWLSNKLIRVKFVTVTAVKDEPNITLLYIVYIRQNCWLDGKKYPCNAGHLLNSCKKAPKKITTDNIRKTSNQTTSTWIFNKHCCKLLIDALEDGRWQYPK